MTGIREENVNVLDRMPCIYYLVQFQKENKEVIRALIDFSSKINAISPTYA